MAGRFWKPSSGATYLLWLDCRDITADSSRLQLHFRETPGLYVTGGSHYGTGGKGFFRMNIACPRTRLEDTFRTPQDHDSCASMAFYSSLSYLLAALIFVSVTVAVGISMIPIPVWSSCFIPGSSPP